MTGVWGGVKVQPPKLLDYHLHTLGTIDGRMTEEEVCQQSIRMGIQEIAFTNHSMLTEPDYTISHESFRKHWENIQVCQQLHPELTIRLGLEVDYYEGRESEVRDSIEAYQSVIGRQFDVILGAVHHLNDVFFSSRVFVEELLRKYDLVTLYHNYFALSAKAVQSQLFDVMAHPDLIKKFNGELTPRVPFEEYHQAAELFVNALIDSEVGMEVNTKGCEQRDGEVFPTEEILALYITKSKKLGKDPIITLGSDAHKLSDVGKHLMEGAKLVQKNGVDFVMRFDKRKSFAFPL